MCTKLTLCSPLRSMSKSVLLCISTLLDGGNHCESARLAVGPRLWGYADSRPALPFFRFQDVQSLRLAGTPALCQHPGASSYCLPCERSLFLRPSTHRQISLVCAACLKTDEPEKCVSIQTHAAVRHSLSRSLSRFAGARTSSPRCGTTKLSEKASASCTDPRSRLADAALAVVQQNGDCQGHPRRCAYVFPRWSPDAELVCAPN